MVGDGTSMKQEIERKFLVTNGTWRETAGEGLSCEQGYIFLDPETVTVRVRLLAARGFLTLKGPTQGISRSEMEYPILAKDAEFMLQNFCANRRIFKKRTPLMFNGLLWEVDEFLGSNQGLVLAEVELEQADQPFEKPPWLGEEVSFDPRYFNAALALHPFTMW